MAFYGKQFVVERDENFDEFVKAFVNLLESLPSKPEHSSAYTLLLGGRITGNAGLGLLEERSKDFFQHKPIQKIEKNGEEYTFTVTTSKGDKVYKYKSGVEFDDTFWGFKVKITVNVDGNKFTNVIKFEAGFTLTIKNVYSDDSFTEEYTHSGWDGVARRFYKAQ